MAKFKFNPNAPYNKYFGSVVNALVSLSIAKKVDKNTSYWLANLVLHWLKKNYQHDNEKFLFANYWEYKRAYSKAKHFFYRLVTNISNSEQFNNILNEMGLNDKDLESVKQKLESYNNTSVVQLEPKSYVKTRTVEIDKLPKEVQKELKKKFPNVRHVEVSKFYKKEFRKTQAPEEKRMRVYFNEVLEELRKALEQGKIDPIVFSNVQHLLRLKTKEINEKLDRRVIETREVFYLPQQEDVFSYVADKLRALTNDLAEDDNRYVVILLSRLLRALADKDEETAKQLISNFRERVLKPRTNVSEELQELLEFVRAIVYVSKALYYIQLSLYQLLTDVLKRKVTLEDAKSILTNLIQKHNILDIIPESSEFDTEFLDTQRITSDTNQELDVSKATLNEKLIA